MNETIVKQKARELLAQGYTPSEVCAACGIEGRLLRVWAFRGKWVVARTAEPETYPDSKRLEVYALADRGLSERKIAAASGVAKTTVRRWLLARPFTAWRCYCTPYGITVREKNCPRCGARGHGIG